jgi:hypothetical protein
MSALIKPSDTACEHMKPLCTLYIAYIFFSPSDSTALVGLGLLIIEASRSHSVRHTTLGRTPLDE